MRLRRLLDPGLTVRGAGWQEVEITALAADSRAVRAGTLFAALPGSRADGRAFIDDALARGAAAVLSDPSLAGLALPVPLILDANPRRRLALMAARLFERQPRCIAAVTTQRQDLGRRLHPADLDRPRPRRRLARHARPGCRGVRRSSNLTTPDPVQLHALLAEVAAAGIDHLALEASSHGLDQHRLDGVRLSAAAFTISHATTSIITAASPSTWPPSAGCSASSCRPRVSPCSTPISRSTRRWPRSAATAASPCSTTARGPSGCSCAPKRRTPRGRSCVSRSMARASVRLALVGGFQAANVLAALGLVVACGADPAAAVGTLAGLRGVRGRLERIAGHPKGAQVFVDYAHTPMRSRRRSMRCARMPPAV